MILAQVKQLPPGGLPVLIALIVIFLAIAFTMSAVLFRASAYWIARTEVGFGNAYFTVFILAIVGGLQQILFRLCLFGDLPDRNEPDPSKLIGFPLLFFIQALIIGSRFELSLAKAVLVHLGAVAIVFVIVAGILAVVFLTLGNT